MSDCVPPLDRTSTSDSTEKLHEGQTVETPESTPEPCTHPGKAVELIATDGLTSYLQCGLCDAVFVLWRS